jgi:hypothetical protein
MSVSPSQRYAGAQDIRAAAAAVSTVGLDNKAATKRKRPL